MNASQTPAENVDEPDASSIQITPFLWLDDNAEAAIGRYLEVFPDGRLIMEQRHPDGSLFLATVTVAGLELTLMNGGPSHRLTPAFSLSVSVRGQAEVDRISDALIRGGGEQGHCGWLVDAFGVSWQIVPLELHECLGGPDADGVKRARDAMLGMMRLSVRGLQDAYRGVSATTPPRPADVASAGEGS